MSPDAPIGFAAVCLTMGIPIVAIVTSHQRKMAEIKMRAGNSVQGNVLEEVRMQLAAMREEIATLRDTSTKFDMSFDAALSRLEGRVDRIEDNRAASNGAYPTAPVQADAERVILGQKG